MFYFLGTCCRNNVYFMVVIFIKGNFWFTCFEINLPSFLSYIISSQLFVQDCTVPVVKPDIFSTHKEVNLYHKWNILKSLSFSICYGISLDMLYEESLNLPIPPQKMVFVEVTRLPKAQYNEGMLCKADCT